MSSDLEIAKSIKLENISNIAEKFGIKEDEIIPYGKYKAKVENDIYERVKDKEDGKLILVTSINPTPLGEGKTTIAIGLSDALNQIGVKSVLALREPSLGPVFGIKGGATGGGYAQVVPMEDINLHFTGDIHAITTANNLLAALIDNHIFRGNELGFKKVLWKRCVDLNDRALRKIEIGLSKEKNMVPREDGFDISVASEIMAIFCLAKDLKDLKEKIGNIVVGLNEENKPILAKELKAEGAMTAVLRDAFSPNLVQTLEHNLAVIHGGPFANIAHGCNSVRATNLALKLGDYVVTEAGFAEKFVDIKCRKAGLKPKVAVCVATLKALKYHGGAEVETCKEENLEALECGIENLLKHVDNIRNVFGLFPIVAINKFYTDTDKEIEFLKKKLEEKDIEVSIANTWAEGGKGTIDLAEKVMRYAEFDNYMEIKYTYDLEENIENKIRQVAKKIYGAADIELDEAAVAQIENIKELGYGNLPVCIAKTQYSLSDDPKRLIIKEDEPFTIKVKSVELRGGAGFIVVKAGKIMTMPGLPKVPAAEIIDVDDNGEIVGLF